MVSQVLRSSIKKYDAVRKHVGKTRAVVQVKLRDGSIGRWYDISIDGVKSKAGLHEKPDVIVDILDVETALAFLNPNADMGEIIHAMKNFRVLLMGDDRLSVWFAQLMNLTASAKLEYGKTMPDGSVRYTQNGNGGPMFVYVKDGKILRIDADRLRRQGRARLGPSARAERSSPRTARDASLAHAARRLKSIVYSTEPPPLSDEARRLRPERRAQPSKPRQVRLRAHQLGRGLRHRRERDQAPSARSMGPARSRSRTVRTTSGAMSAITSRPSSASGTCSASPACTTIRTAGKAGTGARCITGAIRCASACPDPMALVEDCLKNADMIVFWSSDPESTNGYAAGTRARRGAVGQGTRHQDGPHRSVLQSRPRSSSAGKWIPTKPGTDPALSIAIMPTSGSTKDSTTRTTSPTARPASRSGRTICSARRRHRRRRRNGRRRKPAFRPRTSARSPANGATERSISAPAAGALASAAPAATPTGIAMGPRHGHADRRMQGLGKPGVNFGNLQCGAPLDFNFYFPGYAEGGISGELQWTAAAPHTYQRMPHILEHEPCPADGPAPAPARGDHRRQRQGLSAGTASRTRRSSRPTNIRRPAIRRSTCSTSTAASTFGTIAKSSRYVDMYPARTRSTFVVNQSIWMEGERQFRRRHPAGLHLVRALGHQRAGEFRRLCPPQYAPTQSPRDR